MVLAPQLPHILRLLDDESRVVREAVQRALLDFGPSLGRHLEELNPPPTDRHRRAVAELLREPSRAWLAEEWEPALSRESGCEVLETGLALLARFLNGPASFVDLGDQLDALAESARQAIHSDAEGTAASLAANAQGMPLVSGRALAEFLFQDFGLTGNKSDYYHPQNSNLTWVLKQRKGIPISLACVFILVGHRLGLDIRGCNFPGHFLARVEENGEHYFVDCFSRGRILGEAELKPAESMWPDALFALRQADLPPESILARVLRNLMNSFGRLNRKEDWKLVRRLLQSLQARKV